MAAVGASGTIDVLLHCAGLEISHFLPDKPQREYDLVFDVKADGWFNLLHALRETPTSGAAVVFSSIAGRFGNAGQTDYSRGQRPALQERVEHAARRAPDARHRDRLDRLGRNRHGQPRLDPEDDGDRRASTCCRPRSACRWSAAS